MQTYPAGLPLIQLYPMSGQQPWTAPLITPFNAGNQRRRKIESSGTYPHAAKVLYTTAQYITFRDWARDTLKDATLQFTATIRNIDQTSASKTLSILDGAYTVQEAGGGNVIVDMVLEVTG